VELAHRSASAGRRHACSFHACPIEGLHLRPSTSRARVRSAKLMPRAYNYFMRLFPE
jgi:hypothetical protein